MKKTYIIATIILIAVIAVAGTIFFNKSTTTANTTKYPAPEYVEYNLIDNEKKKIVLIKEEKAFKYYLFEHEVSKVINSEDYQKNNNWQMRVFVETTDEKIKKKILSDIRKILEIEEDKPIYVWGLGIDCAYNQSNHLLGFFDRYTYNYSGQIVIGPPETNWNEPIEVTDLTKKSTNKLDKKMAQYTNEYLEKRYNQENAK